MISTYSFDWSDLAFGSKKPVDSLQAFFIAAPRELSPARFTQLVKTYLPLGNIVLGLAKEPHIAGFEDQPHFRTLTESTVHTIIAKVNASSSKHKIYILSYFQRETPYLLEKLSFKKVLLINGSWHLSFHTQSAYYTLCKRGIPYEMLSPFVNEDEARVYEAKVMKELALLISEPSRKTMMSAEEMMSLAAHVAHYSFDYTFQTGAVLGKKTKSGKYSYLTYGFNTVVPYQTHALHHGSAREKNFSPPNDLNHYDTNHAEMEVLLRASQEGIDLSSTTLFVTLMPCSTCARVLSRSSIAGVVCALDHSGSYAVDLFASAGKDIQSVGHTSKTAS